jgi:hypothetical protein
MSTKPVSGAPNGSAAQAAADRVRRARIGNRALLAAACNDLLLRAGAAGRMAA